VRRLIRFGVVVAASGLLLGPAHLWAPAVGLSQPVKASAPNATANAIYVKRKIVNDCYRLVARPDHIDWCGNTSDRFRSLRWSSWGAHDARARGVVRLNDCVPDCAEGTSHRYGVRLRLHRDVIVNGHPRFVRVTYLILDGPYAGNRWTLPLPRKPYR
jgi:hypothetical protein